MSEDAAFVPRAVATMALAVRHSKKTQTTRLDLIEFFIGHFFPYVFMYKNPDPLLFTVD